MTDYNKIQERIDDLEDELKKTKMELECSMKSDFKEEVEKYFTSCTTRNEELKEELEFMREKITSLLEPEKSVGDYNLASTYFTSFKERFSEYDRVNIEAVKARASLLSFINVVRASNSL